MESAAESSELISAEPTDIGLGSAPEPAFAQGEFGDLPKRKREELAAEVWLPDERGAQGLVDPEDAELELPNPPADKLSKAPIALSCSEPLEVIVMPPELGPPDLGDCARSMRILGAPSSSSEQDRPLPPALPSLDEPPEDE